MSEPERAALLLEDIELAPAPMVPEVLGALVVRFRQLVGNAEGGTLRLVLDEGNWERSHVEKARRNALEHEDRTGAALAALMLKLTDAELRAWVGGLAPHEHDRICPMHPANIVAGPCDCGATT